MNEVRVNEKYLPGVKLPDNIYFFDEAEDALEGAAIVMFAVPAQAFGKTLEGALPFIPEQAVVVNVAKGIERGTLRTMSQVAKNVKFSHILKARLSLFLIAHPPTTADRKSVV